MIIGFEPSAQQHGASPKRRRWALIFLIFALAPTAAYANAGTPLMWAGMLHLVFGNALIGIGEGLLLSRFFRVPAGHSITILIGANYVSAWFGGLIIFGSLSSSIHSTIETVHLWFWGFVFIAFLATLVIEFPFYWLAMRKYPEARKRALKATLMVNAISYVLLFGWYWAASGTSMMTGLRVTSVAQIDAPDGYDLYYLANDGRTVLRSGLKGGPVEEIATVNAPDLSARLFARTNDRGTYDLLLHSDPDEYKKKPDDIIILKDFSQQAPEDSRTRQDPDQEVPGTWMNFGAVPKLTTQGDWHYYTGFWAIEGIRGTSEHEKAKFHFSMETPFAMWNVRNATHIADNFVVFQLGSDQICILQPQSKKIALLAHGKGPIVATVKPSPSSTP